MDELKSCAVAGDARAGGEDAEDACAETGERALLTVRVRAGCAAALSCVGMRRGVTGAETVPLEGGVAGGMMKSNCEDAAEVGESGSSAVQKLIKSNEGIKEREKVRKGEREEGGGAEGKADLRLVAL